MRVKNPILLKNVVVEVMVCSVIVDDATNYLLMVLLGVTTMCIYN